MSAKPVCAINSSVKMSTSSRFVRNGVSVLYTRRSRSDGLDATYAGVPAVTGGPDAAFKTVGFWGPLYVVFGNKPPK